MVAAQPLGLPLPDIEAHQEAVLDEPLRWNFNLVGCERASLIEEK